LQTIARMITCLKNLMNHFFLIFFKIYLFLGGMSYKKYIQFFFLSILCHRLTTFYPKNNVLKYNKWHPYNLLIFLGKFSTICKTFGKILGKYQFLVWKCISSSKVPQSKFENFKNFPPLSYINENFLNLKKIWSSKGMFHSTSQSNWSD
jgi:hypothetical protein